MSKCDDGLTIRRGKNTLPKVILAFLVICALWWALATEGCRERGEKVGTVEHEELREISGIVVSRQNPGVIWAHNDSGDLARIFALKTDGTHLATFTLKGAQSIDYEDMALGPGPQPKTDYLYIADTGNNELSRTTATIYRVPEPKIRGGVASQILDNVVALPIRYPSGPAECETLLSDPLTGDLYLVTRRRDRSADISALVFRYPAPQEPGEERTLERVVGFSTPAEIKGGDISPNGQLVLLRAHSNHRRADALLWRWDRSKSLAHILVTPPETVPAAFERQGEAIAFSADGENYYTIGEDLKAPIYRYPVPSPAE